MNTRVLTDPTSESMQERLIEETLNIFDKITFFEEILLKESLRTEYSIPNFILEKSLDDFNGDLLVVSKQKISFKQNSVWEAGLELFIVELLNFLLQMFNKSNGMLWKKKDILLPILTQLLNRTKPLRDNPSNNISETCCKFLVQVIERIHAGFHEEQVKQIIFEILSILQLAQRNYKVDAMLVKVLDFLLKDYPILVADRTISASLVSVIRYFASSDYNNLMSSVLFPHDNKRKKEFDLEIIYHSLGLFKSWIQNSPLGLAQAPQELDWIYKFSENLILKFSNDDDSKNLELSIRDSRSLGSFLSHDNSVFTAESYHELNDNQILRSLKETLQLFNLQIKSLKIDELMKKISLGDEPIKEGTDENNPFAKLFGFLN